METINATVSSRGYIVLPARLRKEMNIKAGTKILLTREENKIILQPVTSFTQELAGLTAQNFGTNPDEVKKYLLNFQNIFCQEITLGVLELVGGNDLFPAPSTQRQEPRTQP